MARCIEEGDGAWEKGDKGYKRERTFTLKR